MTVSAFVRNVGEFSQIGTEHERLDAPSAPRLFLELKFEGRGHPTCVRSLFMRIPTTYFLLPHDQIDNDNRDDSQDQDGHADFE